MFTITKKEIEWGGRTLTIETGRVARQADGAVVVTYGETSVLCTVVSAKQPKPDLDFFPLTVHYIEKYYAAGKIPGGFFKREGRPTEKEVLTSRLIDRPIRPLFDENFRNETQVICTVLSYDFENDPDIPAMVGASAALAISGVPFFGPIAGARVGYINGENVLNPSPAQLEESELDLIVAGTTDSVLMVESEAKELTEETMLNAVLFGHEQMQPVIKLIQELADQAGKPRWEVTKKDVSALENQVAELAEAKLRTAYQEQVKQSRVEKLTQAKQETVEAILEKDPEISGTLLGGVLKKLEKTIVRGNILDSGIRIDGRDTATVRQIVCEVEALPRVHGSALFTRGETQALVVTTLGTKDDEQIIDDISGDRRENFLLHYNFPPYSVGEATPMRPPGRREVGHGKLAWRAVANMLPTKEEFPYTIRLVSEVTESNGSSSMATVCGSSLALMDAGVPIKRPVAGIAMGLIKEGEKFAVLSDILGDEDHLGDMDFKVAGTTKGVTALQMDIKIRGINAEIMKVALEQAYDGRHHILEKMSEALPESRDGVNANAPTITTLRIPKDKIREVIGAGGKVIRELCETSGAKIDITEEGQHGVINVAATSVESKELALKLINEIVAEPEVGAVCDGKVVRIVDFGAFVAISGSKNEGLVHISEIVDRRLGSVKEVLSEGDDVKIKILEVDPRTKKIRLSMRVVDQETGEVIADAKPSNSGGGRRDKGDRDRQPKKQDFPRDNNKDNRDEKPAKEESPQEPKRKRRFF